MAHLNKLIFRKGKLIIISEFQL